MSQLKMYWLEGTPIRDLELPEGYSIVNYKDENDKAAWVECCKNGLVGDDTAPGFFDECVADVDDCVPEKDVFFLDYENDTVKSRLNCIVNGEVNDKFAVFGELVDLF